MLFNSYPFLLFAILTLCGYFVVLRVRVTFAKAFVVLASLFFYAYWKLSYIWLLLFSLLFNYVCGLWLARLDDRPARQRAVLVFGLATNLLLLGYFKYAGLLVSTADSLFGLNLPVPDIVLPIGISFFAFQKIAFLVDVVQKRVRDFRFVDYCLFVTFFPQLIAGPIVHYREMLPQFARHARGAFRWSNLAVGFSIFVIGLAKKMLLADSAAEYADRVFDAALHGGTPGLYAAWAGVLSFAMQIYFDFSAYSDMAVGLGRMFNVRLPVNFYSPYKARSIIDFWRRWHITLSRLLRDYLYIPLGGSRRGPTRRYANLMITMLIGGLWHGANWTFVVWGGLHGVYLMINHGWRALASRLQPRWALPAALQTGITFLAVTVAWVFFRANSLEAAVSLLRGMAGLNGHALPALQSDWLISGLPGYALLHYHVDPRQWVPQHAGYLQACLIVLIGMAIAWGAPNTVQIFGRYRPVIDPSAVTIGAGRGYLIWRPTLIWSASIAALFIASLLQFTRISPFLYFQF